MKPIAAHFWKELSAIAPNLIGRAFTVNDDGSVLDSSPKNEKLTDEEKAIVFSVWESHNPAVNPDQYKLDRAQEYPPIGDQLDAIWKHLNQRRTNGEILVPETNNMLNEIAAVKTKHPKP